MKLSYAELMLSYAELSFEDFLWNALVLYSEEVHGIKPKTPSKSLKNRIIKIMKDIWFDTLQISFGYEKEILSIDASAISTIAISRHSQSSLYVPLNHSTKILVNRRPKCIAVDKLGKLFILSKQD